MLEDEVWRLEKIGKDGAFHKKLASENINTVQDFLKLFVVDRSKLRRILGVGMSEKMWERAMVNGQVFPIRDLSNINRTETENLVREAYANWNSLEMVDAILNDTRYVIIGF
ncbi:protein SAR DEFICIENT 1 [Prunus yedoensis var. nudiflora]|uniref:Protein SAR DEFICIENT 1 n=1 Tax=Prunus yedoensis var. nudiflora TaxID=2094558 RepID=A0A314YVT9_PRUYE|nr:protein SAR DEFICIENT 1 [Prunus yedoensis var. nudiflora]